MHIALHWIVNGFFTVVFGSLGWGRSMYASSGCRSRWGRMRGRSGAGGGDSCCNLWQVIPLKQADTQPNVWLWILDADLSLPLVLSCEFWFEFEFWVLSLGLRLRRVCLHSNWHWTSRLRVRTRVVPQQRSAPHTTHICVRHLWNCMHTRTHTHGRAQCKLIMQKSAEKSENFNWEL